MNKCDFYPYLRTDKGSKRTGLYPLCLQVRLNGSYFKVGMDISVPEKEWNIRTLRVRDGNYSHLNDQIEKFLQKADAIRRKFNDSRTFLTQEEFKEAVLLEQEPGDFIEFFEFELERRFKKSIIAKATYIHNKSVLNLLKKFKPRGLRFAEINVKVIEEFRHWNMKRLELASSIAHKDQVNGSINRIGKIMATIKVYVRLANSNRLMDFNPFDFGRIKIQQVDGTRESLKMWELLRLVELWDLEELGFREKEVLRIFLFSCFSSLRFSDMMAFNRKEFIKESKLSFVPRKNKRFGKVVSIPVSSEIEKYLPDDQFLQILNKDGNDLLKIIQAKAGINTKLTFHVGRHTFATMFLASGGQLQVLQQIMGHAKVTETMKYITVAEEWKLEQMKALGAFIKEAEQKNKGLVVAYSKLSI